MASQDKKISSLAEWIYTGVQDAASIVVAHAGNNYRIALSTLKQYVLGNRVIGGGGSRDITTNTDTQILTNKRLDSPSFNDDVELDWRVTATQMNLLSGLDVNVNQSLISIDSDISTIESNIKDLDLTVNALQADKIYSENHSAGGTSIVLNTRAIDASNDINPKSLSISVYEYYMGTGTTLKLLSPSNIVISKSGEYLSNITIGDVVPGMAYQIVIRYRVLRAATPQEYQA